MKEPRHIAEILQEILETQKAILERLNGSNLPHDSSVVSITQAARLTGKSINTIRNYMEDGKVIVGVKAGRKGIVESSLKRIMQ